MNSGMNHRHVHSDDKRVTILVPQVSHNGSNDIEAHIYRRAAENLDRNYELDGSYVRAAVAMLLRRVATELDGNDVRASTDHIESQGHAATAVCPDTCVCGDPFPCVTC